MGSDAPGEPRVGPGHPAQLRGRVHRHEARDGGDGVAVMVTLEQAGLGEGLARPSSVEDQAAPLGRGADKFQHSLAHEAEAEGGVACTEQRLAMGEAAAAAGRQGLEEVGVHMTAVIEARAGSALRAPVMTLSAALPIAALALALALPASAQQAGPQRGHHPHGAERGSPALPYAGLEGRRIKALSEDDIGALLEGRGMGLALAAEMNGYPGPVHVLEHADALRLSPAQQATAEALRDGMAREARLLGARIVGMESDLDRLFATGSAEIASLAALTASIGALSGRLREVHLATHIAMREALRPEQRAAYARLRGYAAGR